MQTMVEQMENGYEELSVAFQELEQKNKDLLDSLYYASSVQQGLMPQDRHFKKLANPYFVYYQPAKIIGGDFYWLAKKEDWVFYAVGDCTGHGLSGAMLSSLAIGFLNYLVYSKPFETVGVLLNELDKKWIETFKHDEEEQVNNDWMEIALIAYNAQSHVFQYSAAKRKSMVVSPTETMLLEGNNYPIGGWQIEKNRVFTTTKIELIQPFSVFLFSDGLQDQFGGPKNKRFGTKNLYELIRHQQHLSMERMRNAIVNEFLAWKGEVEQTDDVCLLGVSFT